MDTELQIEQGKKLGQDFLTWLWSVSEKNNGHFVSKNGEDFFLYFEQKIAVVGGEGESLERTVVTGRMSEMKEAKLGLKNGKKVNQAQIHMEQDQNDWQLVLRGEDFSFSGFKTPKVQTKLEDGDEPDAPFLEKMFLMEKGLSFIDSLYAAYLSLRLSGEWDEERARVRDWIESA